MQSNRDVELSKLQSFEKFPLWEFGALSYLEELELDKYIRSDDPTPIPQPAAEGYATFQRNQKKAIRVLLKTLDERTQSLVLEHRDIVSFWRTLQARVEIGNEQTNISQTTSKLVTQCPANGNVVQHIANMNIQFSNLQKLGQTFEDPF